MRPLKVLMVLVCGACDVIPTHPSAPSDSSPRTDIAWVWMRCGHDGVIDSAPAPIPRERLAEALTAGLSEARPNLRLKLSGLLLKESAVALPGAPPGGGPVPCARGHAARRLSAIR